MIAIRILTISYVWLLYSETVRFAYDPLNLDKGIKDTVYGKKLRKHQNLYQLKNVKWRAKTATTYRRCVIVICVETTGISVWVCKIVAITMRTAATKMVISFLIALFQPKKIFKRQINIYLVCIIIWQSYYYLTIFFLPLRW